MYQSSPAFNPLNVDFFEGTEYKYEALRQALLDGMPPEWVEQRLAEQREARREYFYGNPDVGEEMWGDRVPGVPESLYYYH
jgi:hypothetical protein